MRTARHKNRKLHRAQFACRSSPLCEKYLTSHFEVPPTTECVSQSTSHSPQASAWGCSRISNTKPFQRFLLRPHERFARKTVETVSRLRLPPTHPRLKPGENEKLTATTQWREQVSLFMQSKCRLN